jgi:hypothetical protein
MVRVEGAGEGKDGARGKGTGQHGVEVVVKFVVEAVVEGVSKRGPGGIIHSSIAYEEQRGQIEYQNHGAQLMSSWPASPHLAVNI